MVWWFLRTRPPAYLLLGTAVITGVSVVLAVPSWKLYREWQSERFRNAVWRQLDQHILLNDLPAVEEDLTILSNHSPDDERVQQRLEAIRSGQAPTNDAKLARLLMRWHLQHARLDEAAREAAKLIVHEPHDWEARCISADYVSRRGDREALRNHLISLPRAASMESGIGLGAALYSARLFRGLGDEEHLYDLTEYIILRLLPYARSGAAFDYDPVARLQLVECYQWALLRLDGRPKLTQYWAPTQALCRSVVESEPPVAAYLTYLGELEEAHLGHLKDFLERELITQQEQEQLTREVEDRLAVVWDKVLALEPKNVKAHLGRAMHLFRTGAKVEAIAGVGHAIDTCGELPELIAVKALFLRDHDPQAGLAFLEQALKSENLTAPLCQVLAEAARATGRFDKVLDACRRAEEIQPGLYWANRAIAEICMLQDKPTDAATALGRIRKDLGNDKAGTALYVRALCACGAVDRASEFLGELGRDQRPTSVLLSGADALKSLGHEAEAERWARQVLERDRINPAANLTLADCLRAQAEVGERGWDAEKVQQATQRYRLARHELPDNIAVINNLAWLELKALGQTQEAFETSAPLRERPEASLSPECLETLGAIYLGVGRPDDARRVLERAIATGGPRASFYLHLAQAYHDLQRSDMVEQSLSKAASLPRTKREDYELHTLIKTLQTSFR
jgi:tetratricopeptide (TPR) repeat protein